MQPDQTSLYSGDGRFPPFSMEFVPGAFLFGKNFVGVNPEIFHGEMSERCAKAGITEAQWRIIIGSPEVQKITCTVCREEKETSKKGCLSDQVCDECTGRHGGIFPICQTKLYIVCAVCREEKDIPKKGCPNNHPELVCDECLVEWKRVCTEPGGTPCPICRKQYY